VSVRFLISFAVIGLSVAPTFAQNPAPTFPNGTSYAEARDSLIGLGWSPVTLPGSDLCSRNDERCAGRPEMHACSGTGLAPCAFAWRRGDTLIEVLTIGERPVVNGSRCRAGC
jgi:hypothetical protein